jgi:hypothetical protein
MGMQEYRDILKTACAAEPAWSAEKILVGNPVHSNDVPVWMQYFEPADLCRIVVDLGALDGECLPAVWRMMLESNCTNTSPLLSFLSINPADGHAILVMHLSMDAFRKHASESSFSNFLDKNLEPVVTSWRKGTDAILSFSHADGQMLGSGFA